MQLKNLDTEALAILEGGLRVKNGSMDLSLHSAYGDENHNAVIFQKAPGYGKFIVGKDCYFRGEGPQKEWELHWSWGCYDCELRDAVKIALAWTEDCE